MAILNPPGNHKAAPKQATIDPLKADFRNFLFVVWKHLNLPVPTAVQYDIGYYLHHGPKRCVIEAFRGVGKSYVTSAFVVWLLYCNPQLNILVVSASKDRSDQFSSFTKRLIAEMPILAHLRARPGQRDSMVAFDVGPARNSHSPSIKSVGITGQLAGSRADIIIADDVEVPNNSMTQLQRDQLSERVKEFDAILKPLPTSRIIYLGTPQTEMSLYNRLPERGYEIRVWPARVPNDIERYRGGLSDFVMKMIEAGAQARDPVDPARFAEQDLIEREASYGRSGFALQFMLDTSLSDQDKYPLKLSDLIVSSLDPRMAPAKLVWCNDPEKIISDLPSVGLQGDRLHRPMWTSNEMAEYSGSVMAIDPSGKGGDETAYAIVKILHGNLFLVASGGFKEGYAETTLKALATLGKVHNVNRVIVEANFGDGMFTQLLKPVFTRVHPVTIEEVKHSTQKERRICDVLEPVLNQHRLVVDSAVVKRDFEAEPHRQLFYQLTRITRDRGALINDDRLDALAIAVTYWVEHMARDTDKAAEDHRAEMLKRELESFSETVFGRTNDDNLRWFNIG
ncbi:MULTISPECIES: phage terminase large subunit [unclassified Agrobacterium]|uniref:phage terminase large subunit n=1 Tax=unclassified Agrobacterium TaxID=2632611 RepID=UPI00244BCCFD|nr:MULTISPECIES: phage terminase large subunit [unclassified Agrobacterium]MDH0613322.1 phage terminase large subunit [Agrobacterium sp. GD03872]MDH0697239.1 phage terminase large subunit [Agrobacterium sp. GD03871]MDH1062172.1 phage terminase large subunit [Agrobacterium sp. GD03992]MDH2211346.1 phage terminase large subunit [Agrobacterium sp. GD03643]MDH2220605.1 phage terminase large subunit [Agrobacterium sp. GD03638]